MAIGNEILEIHAIDRDDGINAEMVFYFDESHNTDSKAFTINPQTGKIYLNGKLNRENQTLYNVKLFLLYEQHHLRRFLFLFSLKSS